jgi:hypothetical protein
MKNKLSFFILLALSLAIFSCKKNDSTPVTPTPPTPEQMLSSSSWKIDELRFSQVNTSGGGTAYYYKRGVTGNISNFDNENILFLASNTGTYTLGSSNYPITWQFTNAEKSKLQFIVTYSPTSSMTVFWENVVLTSTTLKYAEYYTTTTGITSLGSGTRIH